MSEATPDVVELADTVSAILYGIAGWLSIGFGLLAAFAAVSGLLGDGVTAPTVLFTGLLFTVAFVFIALGVFVNPWFRRRINRRHELSAFGWVRSVDQRIVRSDEHCTERCVDCRSPVDRGLIRRYREEYAVAGVPLYTRSEGYNHYCLDCASAELLGPETVSDRHAESDGDRTSRRTAADGTQTDRRTAADGDCDEPAVE